MSFAIDDEPVKLLLSGIFKSGKTVFFKIDSSGKHEKVNVGLILRSLNLSHGAVSRLIAAFLGRDSNTIAMRCERWMRLGADRRRKDRG
jgi:hypothetical protein